MNPAAPHSGTPGAGPNKPSVPGTYSPAVERIIANKGGVPHVVMLDERDIWMLEERKWTVIRSNNVHYLQGRFNGKNQLLHRLIAGAGPGEVVDHINRNGLDNRRENLRVVTTRQNACNRVKGNFPNATTKLKGVYKKTPTRWTAQISVNNCVKHIGYFASDVEAARAYDAAAKAAYGEYARLNFPDEAAQ